MAHDSVLLHDDDAARRSALDVSRSFIVQAPAGSGKTELLIQRYLRLLATVENPEEVLAITFTRKAASEMQLRVLRALERAAVGEPAGPDHEKITLDAARGVLRADHRHGWDLLVNPRRLRIQTLDALNASIARAQPLTTPGGVAGSGVGNDSEIRLMYAEAAMLTLDQLLESGSARAAAELVLGHLDNKTGLYVDYLARMLATRDQWLPFVGSGLIDAAEAPRLRRVFERNLEHAVGRHLEALVVALPADTAGILFELGETAARELAAAGNAEHPACVLQGLTGGAGTTPAAVSEWQAVAELLLTRRGEWRRTVTKAQGFPAGKPERTAMLELLARLADEASLRQLLHGTRQLPPVRYSDEQWAVLLALFRLLPLAVTELKRLFAARGVTDYTEVALNAEAALGSAERPGDVTLLLDYQLRHLLVDEMQDTSSAQYRMLEALTGGWVPGDGRTLFCVGDPMQSIYRFRNAEVGQFILARTAGIGSIELQPLTLRRNFRSGEILVDWFNSTFPSVLADTDDAAKSAVAYTAAAAVESQRGRGICHVHPVFSGTIDAEAEVGSRLVQDLLERHPDDDVALLVRGRTQLPALLARLRAIGVAYRAVDIDRLTDLPEIADLLALTRAVVHRGDRLAWLALLRSPWAGLDWQDLHSLVNGATRSTVWELLHDGNRLARLSDFGRSAAERLRREFDAEIAARPAESLRTRIERLWLALGGPAVLRYEHEVENVYRYLDVLEQVEVAGTLRDVAALETALDLERVSSSREARLQVMTMHRAKGLQFDHVILFGLGRTAARTELSVLSWFDVPVGHGKDEKIVSPVGPRANVDNDPVHRFIERSEAVKDRNETARLLYVACTRAKHSLHLVGHVSMSADGESYRLPRADSLLALLWHAVHDDFDAAFRPGRDAAGLADEGVFVRPVLRRFGAPWTLPETSRPARQDRMDGRGGDEQKIDYDWVGSDARLAGTVVHRWLQLGGSGRIVLHGADADWLAATSRRWLAECGAAPEAVGRIVARILAALQGITTDQTGRWLLDAPGHCELALSGIVEGSLVSVVVDRVLVDDEGTHWIIDYKTSTHEGGGLSAFLESEAKRYRPQLRRYAHLYSAFAEAPVRCALYFPLHREFVEVPL